MVNDELAWGTLLVSALGTLFLGVQALKAVAARAEIGLQHGEFLCPNCGQPFSRQSFYCREKAFPITVDGRHIVSCPRCWYTFEA